MPPTDVDPAAFLASVAPDRRRTEAVALDALFRQVTGWAPRMWGPSIVGYGRYGYRYDSGHAGDTLATGFSPRAAKLVVYILPGFAAAGALLADLGPHRLGKSCLYLTRLDRVDMDVLARLVRAGLDDLATRWTVEPT
jgi:hypothetical protein